jgi:23S rRNA pseudouridine1911/1915/1917 synthase
MEKTDGKNFRVRRGEAGQTVAAALRNWLEGTSWNQARQLVAGRRVMIDGNLCLDAGRRLKQGEVVKLLPRAGAAPPRDDDVRVRHVDRHVVVVEKPAGMTSLRHRQEQRWPARRRQIQPTLDEVLARVLAKRERRPAKGGRDRSPPLRPVHRIDRDTSGLLVFARSLPAERHLGQQFRRHTVRRRYLAIVLGDLAAGTIRSRIIRDRGDGRRGSTRDPKQGKEAITHVRPLEKLGGYTLVECRLETGRTHQIRIHLAESGHPLCGDKVYRKPLGGAPLPDRSGAPRLALHAAELGFVHPLTSEELRFEVPLPRDLAEFLARLRHEARSGGC